MRYAIACLLQAVLFLACSTEEVEPQKRDDQGLVFPQRIDFPPTGSGSTSVAAFTLRNEGDEARVVWLEIPDMYTPFAPKARRLELAPREERTVRLLFGAWSTEGRHDTIAYLHSGGEARPLWLLGEAYGRCEDACSVRLERGGPCVPAPEGMACGDASECSDGAFCRNGACEPGPERSGARCVTDCGSEGRCGSDRCLLDASAFEPAWTWESLVRAYTVHSDTDGTLIRAGQSPGAEELIRLDHLGRPSWRVLLPDEFEVQLPAYEGLLFASSTNDWAAYDIETGEVRWRREKDEQRWTLAEKSASLLVFSRRTDEQEEPPALYLQGVDPVTGVVLWTREVLARTGSVLGGRLASGSPRLASRGEHLRLAMSAAVLEPPPGSQSKWRYALFALDPATGNERWARAGGSGEPHRPKIDDAGRTFVGVYLGIRQGEVHAFDAAGQRIWTQSTGTYDLQGYSTNGPVRAENDVVLLQDRTALDAATGTVRYVAPVAAEIVAGDEAKAAYGRVWVDSWLKGVVGFDLESGEQRFSLPLEPSLLYPVEGSTAVGFVLQRYHRGEELDSALCTLDADGAVINERQLPALPNGQSYLHSVHPPHWIRWTQRTDGTTRLEAWPLPD